MNPSLAVALLDRYPRAEYVLLPEVPESVGGGGRRADYLAVNLWRSRGLELHGLEVKHSRSDWLREKNDPAKADKICRFCDRWYLVAASDEIAKPEELPPTWGLLVMRGKRLVEAKKAPKLKPVDRPWSFIVGLLRVAQDELIPKVEVDSELLERARADAEEAAERRHAATAEGWRKQYEISRQTIYDMEQSIGMSTHQLRGRLMQGEPSGGERVQEAMRFLAGKGEPSVRRRLEGLLNELEGLVRGVRSALEVRIPPPGPSMPDEMAPEERELRRVAP